MKPWHWLLIGLVAGGLLGWAATPKIGRYTIHYFPNTVLRLDTQTGATWEWEGKGWKQFQEP